MHACSSSSTPTQSWASLKVLFVCLFVFRSVFSSSPGHLPVSTILPFSLSHAAEVLYFLEGSFYTFLVPRFCSCCPGDTPQWPGPGDQRVCVPGSQGTITMGKFALSRLPTTSRTLYRWPAETQPSLFVQKAYLLI